MLSPAMGASSWVGGTADGLPGASHDGIDRGRQRARRRAPQVALHGNLLAVRTDSTPTSLSLFRHTVPSLAGRARGAHPRAPRDAHRPERALVLAGARRPALRLSA